jgi:outer membrane protein TolC
MKKNSGQIHMKKNLFTISIIVEALMLIFHSVTAHAITRREAVQYAMDNAESIRMVRQNAQQTREVGRQSVAFLKPQVNLVGGYMRLETNAPKIPIPELDYPEKDLLAQAELSQILYAGGRILRSLELEKNLYKQADQQELSDIRDIVKVVKSTFDAVLFQKAAMDILQDRFVQRQKELEDARNLWEAGVVILLDVRQAQLSLNFADDGLKESEASHMQALIDFNVSMGRSGGEQLLFPKGTLDEMGDLDEMLHCLYAGIDNQDLLDIELRKTEAEAARLNHQIVRGDYYPELRFLSTAATQGESRTDMDEFWSVGLQMRWKFLDGGLTRARSAEAGAQLRSARENLERTKKDLSGLVEKISVNHETLQKRKLLQIEAVKLAEENYEDAREQYRAGTITLTDLGVFNLRFAEARFNLIQIYFLQRQLMVEAEALLENKRTMHLFP